MKIPPNNCTVIHHKRYIGFSLVEIIIAIGILALLATSVITFIKGLRTDIEYTSDNFFSTIISQKIIQDTIEEFSINPLAAQTLAINQVPNEYLEITDGSSIFFKYLEDRKPPWGIINPSVDGTLDNTYQPMYNQLKKFKYMIWAQQLSNKANIAECNIKIKWQKDRGFAEVISKFHVFSPSKPKKVNLALVVDETQIDNQIPQIAFCLPNLSIPQIATRFQENVETITAWGRIAVILKQFFVSNQYKSSIQTIINCKNALANNSYTDLHSTYNNILATANAWYDHSKMLLHVMAYLLKQFQILQQNSRFENNFNLINRTALIQDLGKFKILCKNLFGSLIQSRYYYYLLLEQSIVKYKGNKIQLLVILKLLDLYRICAIIPTRNNGIDELHNFLERIKKISCGTYPALHRLADSEIHLIRNRSLWLESFPNLKTLNENVFSKIPEICSFVENLRKKAIASISLRN